MWAQSGAGITRQILREEVLRRERLVGLHLDRKNISVDLRVTEDISADGAECREIRASIDHVDEFSRSVSVGAGPTAEHASHWAEGKGRITVQLRLDVELEIAGNGGKLSEARRHRWKRKRRRR